METPAYHPELWRDLFLMIGTSAGALVGLLFIVVTLHFDKISERGDDNMRATIEGARNNTFHLLTVLVEAAAVLTPQPLPFLGVELIALNAFGLRLPFTIIYKYFGRVTISARGGFPMGLILTVIAAYLVGIVGGMATFSRLDWGLYLVAASCVAKLVRAVLTAWMLMFGANRVPATKQP